jgi:hypothetical protein
MNQLSLLYLFPGGVGVHVGRLDLSTALNHVCSLG